MEPGSTWRSLADFADWCGDCLPVTARLTVDSSRRDAAAVWIARDNSHTPLQRVSCNISTIAATCSNFRQGGGSSL